MKQFTRLILLVGLLAGGCFSPSIAIADNPAGAIVAFYKRGKGIITPPPKHTKKL